VAGWKKQGVGARSRRRSFPAAHAKERADVEKDELFQRIGRLKVELDSLKKSQPAQLRTNADGSIPGIPA
jgi:hypothetical protein